MTAVRICLALSSGLRVTRPGYGEKIFERQCRLFIRQFMSRLLVFQEVGCFEIRRQACALSLRFALTHSFRPVSVSKQVSPD